MNKNVHGSCEFRALTEADIRVIIAAFTEIGWDKPASIFKKYLEEQKNNERCVWVALKQNVFVGYVTLKWHSAYQPFADKNIPEISDLNVLPTFRRQGIASKLLDLAEAAAREKNSCVGLGVGLFADYGDAQKLYVKRGYVPDGYGITYQNKPVEPWDTVRADDDLILWLVKKLNT